MTHLLLTRPKLQSERFFRQVNDRLPHRFSAVHSPAIEIRPVVPERPIDFEQDVIFTSEAAVHAVSKLAHKPNGTAWCVGDQTARAAASCGFKTQNAKGNADDLVSLIKTNGHAGPYQYVCGDVIAQDIQKSLNLASIESSKHVVYRQYTIPLTAVARAVLLGEEAVILPLFSYRTATVVFSEIRIQAPVFVVAISNAVARAVPQNCVTQCEVANKPNGTSMIDVIEGLNVT